MTAQEVIATIRAEIERRIMYHRNLADTAAEKNLHNTMESNDLLVRQYGTLLPLLSDLEKSVKPMNQDGLEEEIKRYYDDWDGNCRYAQTARHFAQWGAEHASGSSEIPKDLEEAARQYFENPENSWEVRDVFIAGAKWDRMQMMKDGLDAVKSGQSNKIEKTIAGVFVKYGMDRQKEQMMKGAVEITLDFTHQITLPFDGPGFGKKGDKIRIIIIKDDGKSD